VAPGKPNERATCPKDKLEFKFFQALLFVRKFIKLDRGKPRSKPSLGARVTQAMAGLAMG